MRVILIKMILCAYLAMPTVAQVLQGPTTWSPPIALVEGYCVGGSGTTSLLADHSGNLHAFWACAVAKEPNASTNLYYARYDGTQWTEPVDIAVDARTLAAVQSQDGSLHLFWSPGIGHNLYHMWSDAPDPASARNWSPPQIIGPGAQDLQVALDGQGILHMVYAPGSRDVVYMQSADGGFTWTSPVSLVSGGALNRAYRYAQVAPDGEGRLHAVWSSYPLPEAWPPLEIAYSRSRDGGSTWSEPVNLRDERFNPTSAHDEPAVLAGEDGTVYVAWNGGVDTLRRFFRVSEDGGDSWRPVEPIAVSASGIIGRPALALDGAGTLHMVTPSADGLHYVTYRAGQLSSAQQLTSGSVNDPAIAISHGNRLHVLAIDSRGAWYLERGIDAPYVAPASSPRATSVVAPTPTPTQTQPTPSEPTETRLPVAAFPDVGPSPQSSTAPVVWGILPTVALVLGILLWRLGRRRL